MINDRWIAGSVGPYGAALADGSEYRGDYDISIDELRHWHRPRIELLVEAGVDVLALETIPCLAEVEALLAEIDGSGQPCWLSITCSGDRTRAGEPAAEAFARCPRRRGDHRGRGQLHRSADADALVRRPAKPLASRWWSIPTAASAGTQLLMPGMRPATFRPEDVERLDQRRRAPGRRLLPRRPERRSGQFVILSDDQRPQLCSTPPR